MKKGYKSPEDFETIDELCHTLRLPAGEQGNAPGIPSKQPSTASRRIFTQS
ncbi:MAG: hypothetical protein ACLRNW_17225 [Neglectibacter sp.]